MSIEAVITQTLSTWPGLLGVLVRPDKAELSDTAPILVVQKITGQRVQSLTGDSGLAHDIFQFDVYASTRLTAVALSTQVRLALQANLALAPVHLSEGASYDSDSKLFRTRTDFSFWFYD